jgi:hypothetical protein
MMKATCPHSPSDDDESNLPTRTVLLMPSSTGHLPALIGCLTSKYKQLVVYLWLLMLGQILL